MCFGSQPYTGDPENDPNKGMRFVDPAYIAWLQAHFGTRESLVYPNGKLPFIRRGPTGGREYAVGNFGLLPPDKSWIRKPADGRKYYNARAETLFEKPTYREAARFRRAIVLVRAFYEYSEADQEPGGKARLYEISRDEGGPIPIASVWERHPQWGLSVSFVTTEAIRQVFEEAHHVRSPLILESEQIDGWLDPDRTDAAAIQPFLKPWAGGKLRVRMKAR
jgi:putative SOS response-associated peptidase YedK